MGADFHYTNTDGIHVPITENSLTSPRKTADLVGYTKPYEQRYDVGWNAEYKGFKLDGRFNRLLALLVQTRNYPIPIILFVADMKRI